MNFAKTVSAALNIPDWRLFYIRTQDSGVAGCKTVKFGIIGNGKYSTFTTLGVFVMSERGCIFSSWQITIIHDHFLYRLHYFIIIDFIFSFTSSNGLELTEISYSSVPKVVRLVEFSYILFFMAFSGNAVGRPTYFKFPGLFSI